MDQVRLTWTMDYGTPGCDTCDRTPLARAIRQLFETGKPFSNLCMCFFNDPSGTLRWLGVFVLSAGGKVIFFPGFINNFDCIKGYHGASQQWNKSFDFDHVSLEKDHSKWHVTSNHSEDHLGSPKTLPLDKERFLWFGLSVASLEVMRVVKTETKLIFDTPASDVQRRYEIFRKAREGVEFPIVSLNDDSQIPSDEWFLHFGFIVGPKGFEPYPGRELGFPYGSPFLVDPLPDKLPDLPIRSHRIELSDEMELQVSVCCLPGKLKVPIALTCRGLKFS